MVLSNVPSSTADDLSDDVSSIHSKSKVRCRLWMRLSVITSAQLVIDTSSLHAELDPLAPRRLQIHSMTSNNCSKTINTGLRCRPPRRVQCARVDDLLVQLLLTSKVSRRDQNIAWLQLPTPVS